MTEQTLMTGVTIIFLLGILIYLIIRTIRKHFPSSAFIPFKTSNEIFDYYKSAFFVISKKRWLYLFPLCLTLSAYLIKIPLMLYQQYTISSFSENIWDWYLHSNNVFSFKNIISSLGHAPKMLDFGYFGSISGSIIFFGFFLIYTLTFKSEIKRIKRYTSENNIQNVIYFETLLKLSRLIIIVVVLFGIIILFTKSSAELIFLLLEIGFALIGLMSLSLFSLIEAFILFSVKGVLENQEYTFDRILNKSLNILKPLFILNVMFSGIGYLPDLVLLPKTYYMLLSMDIDASFSLNILPKISVFLSYFNSMFTMLTFCVPFVLISQKTNLSESFKNNFKFIADNFLKYSTFVGIGILLLFVPQVLIYITNLIRPLSLYSTLMGIFIDVVKLSISVIFYIATFKFFLDSKYKEVIESRINDDQGRPTLNETT